MVVENPQHCVTNIGITILLVSNPGVHWLAVVIWLVVLAIGTSKYIRKKHPAIKNS